MADDKILHTIIQIRRDTTANWNTNGNLVLAEGEPALDTDTGLVKYGDGKTPYKDLKVSGKQASHYEGVKQAGEFDNDVISRVLTSLNTTASKDDIFIVKSPISTGIYSYTAFVYNGTNWVAMDGNYNAENVYFSEDMLFTYAFGKYKLNNGNVTIPSAGKNLKELLMSAHVDIIDPTITEPSFSLSASSNVSKEVGSTYSLPTATATFTDGTYSYGYEDENGYTAGTNTKAGITPEYIEIICLDSSDTKKEYNKSSATLSLTVNNLNDEDMQDLIVTDDSITYDFEASCKYPASERIPTNNVGSIYSEEAEDYEPIAGGEWNDDVVGAKGSKTASCTISGWRKMFVGTVTSTNTNTAIDSTMIRSTMTKQVDKQVSTSAQEFTAPVGATKIIVACPTGYVLSKCEYFTMSWEEISLFPHLKDGDTNKMVPVADARNQYNADGSPVNPKDYHVYVFTHASPSGFEADTKYRITLKKG